MKSWSAQLKACCRIGGWNHHSGHRAMIVCNKCTQRSAIVFLTPGQLAGQMHTPRIHCKEHTQTKKLVSNTKSGPKNGVNFRTYNLLPCLLGWFSGPLIGLRNGPRNAAFFPPFALSFGAQHGRSCNDSLCAAKPCPTRGLQSQAALVSAQRIESCEQSPGSGRHAPRGACFWGFKNKQFWLRGCGPSL